MWKPGKSTLIRQRLKVEAPVHELTGIHYGGQPALGCAALLQSCPFTARNGSILTLISDGVSLESERLSAFPPGYKLWVSARGLRTDLSHFRVVKDDDYVQLISCLRTLIQTVYQSN